MLGKGDCCPVGLARIPLWYASHPRPSLCKHRLSHCTLTNVLFPCHYQSPLNLCILLQVSFRLQTDEESGRGCAV